MTPYWDWFYSYEPISEGSVYIGNDHALEILVFSTIRVKMHDGIIRKIYKEYVICKGVEEELIVCWIIG